MKKDAGLDIYQYRSRNLRRLGLGIAFFTVTVMAASGLVLYLLYILLHNVMDYEVSFLLPLSLFWIIILIYAILRYIFGGRLAFRKLLASFPGTGDYRLEQALTAAKLASGMQEDVTLLVSPHADINAFSVSLPDASHVLFATRGMADKLPQREREAIMAHEIAHMQMGDCVLHTALIYLAGRRAMKKLAASYEHVGRQPYVMGAVIVLFIALVFIVFTFVAFSTSGNEINFSFTRIDYILAICVVFLAFALSLPALMSKLLQFLLDREREHYADMEAVKLTRDPEAVYLAIKYASEDVLDVMILPSCFDALLFHPVVDYTRYRPFRTQPTMGQRMQYLLEAFPILAQGGA